MSLPPAERIRVFSYQLDGAPRHKAIAHPAPNTADDSARELELNRLFSEWLEKEAPGALRAGRITRISFVDDVHTPVEQRP